MMQTQSNPGMVTHPSTHRDQRRATTSTETNVSPLHKTAGNSATETIL